MPALPPNMLDTSGTIPTNGTLISNTSSTDISTNNDSAPAAQNDGQDGAPAEIFAMVFSGIVLITFFWKFLFRGQCIRRADRETREERKERLSRHLICDNKMHQNYFTKQYDLIHQQTAYLALLISQTQPVGSLGVIRPAYPASHHQNDIEDTSYPPSVSSSGMEKSSNAIRRANRSDPEVSPWMIRHPEPEPASRCGAEGASPEHEEHGAVLPLAASPSRTSVISGSIATNTPRGSIATLIPPPPGFSIERAKQDLLRPRSDSDSSSDIIFANLAD